MKSQDIVEAISNIEANAEYVLTGTELDSIQWFTNPIEISLIQAELEKLPFKREQKKQEEMDKKKALLNKLGITEEDAKLLLS